MKTKRLVLLLFIAICALLLLYLGFRNSLLTWYFNKTVTRIKSTYGVKVSAKQIHFTSIKTVGLWQILVQSNNDDTLVNIKKLSFDISFFGIAGGRKKFDQLVIDSVQVQAYNLPQHNNLSFLQLKKDTAASAGRVLYGKRADALNTRLAALFNNSYHAQHVELLYKDSTRLEQLYIPYLNCGSGTISGMVINKSTNDTLVVHGTVENKGNHCNLTITNVRDQFSFLPFFDVESKITCRFKSLTVEWEGIKNGDDFRLKVNCAAQDFHLYHWRINTDETSVKQFSSAALFTFSDNAIELDSSSSITVNKIPCRLFCRYQKDADSLFALALSTPYIKANDFFESLPDGTFNTVKGIKCNGELSYSLFFKLPFSQPDSLIFESALNRKNLQLVSFGEENFARVNEPFTYRAYAGKQFVRNIEVGPANPMFTPLGKINPYLIHAVLQSEDPGFMNHRGFIIDAFRESIATDFKERRFARGGSTISMQLVKNVFLNRNKTIARKAEEVLDVYLIENLGLISKERMLEIYLNVIEWGPNIYGIGEASRFYFNKTPAQLTLNESIFLAGIIPIPKYFNYHFDNQGMLKPYFANYFTLLTSRLLKHDWISAADTTNLVPSVQLKGPALLLLHTNQLPANPVDLESLPESE